MLVDWEIDYFKARFLKINVNLRKTNSSMTTAIPEKMEELTQELVSTLTLRSKMFFQIIYHPFINHFRSVENFPSMWQSPSEVERYQAMSDALASVKDLRNITFELCAWGFGNVETFGPSFGHLWRTSMDIKDTWEQLLWNIDINDESRYRQEGVQGPEHGWNYPDGLFVGKGGMTNEEYRTMFALWCLVKSPLMLGTDIRTLTKDSEAYR